MSPLIARRLRSTATVRNPDALVDLTYDDFSGAIRPLQIRNEFREMIRRVAKASPRRILEIGTANGGTLFALTRSAVDDATVISVDLPIGLFGGGYPAWKKSLYTRFAVSGQRLHLIRGNSHSPAVFQQVRQHLGIERLDVLFIDGDHRYEGVKADYNMYAPLLRAGGLLILHDIVESQFDRSVEVARFWRELKSDADLAHHSEIIADSAQGYAGIGIAVKR